MVDSEEIRKIADLARLELSDEEVETLRKNFSGIKEFFGRLSSIDISDADEADASADEYREILREDEPEKCNINISDFSKFEENNTFVVPKVIE